MISEDMFIDQLTRAIARCIAGDGLSRVVDWTPDPPPASEQTDALAIDAALPCGVTWNQRHNRIYAYCYVPDRERHSSHKIVFPQLTPTAATAALAGRVAAAARACRDAGGDPDAVRAAGREVGEL